MQGKTTRLERLVRSDRGKQRERCAELVPTSWLDPLLSGPSAVVGKPPYDCQDVERLLKAVAERIRKGG